MFFFWTELVGHFSFHWSMSTGRIFPKEQLILKCLFYKVQKIFLYMLQVLSLAQQLTCLPVELNSLQLHQVLAFTKNIKLITFLISSLWNKL